MGSVGGRKLGAVVEIPCGAAVGAGVQGVLRSAQDDRVVGLIAARSDGHLQSPVCFAILALASMLSSFSIFTLAMRWPSISSTV